MSSCRQIRRGRKVAEIPVVVPAVTAPEGKKSGVSSVSGPTGYGYTRGSQEFVESRGRQTKVVKGRTAGGERAELRQGGRGRPVAPIPPVYVNDEYEDYGDVYQDYGEEYQDYGDEYRDYREEYEESQDRFPEDRNKYPEDRNKYPEVGTEIEGGYEGSKRDQDAYGSQESENDRRRQEETVDQSQTNSDEDTGGEVDDGECGPECRNLLHELEHPKEHDRCPNAGMVIDIWGYCRYIFHEERRDWAWWENLRTFVQGGGNSWYNSYRPTAYEEQG